MKNEKLPEVQRLQAALAALQLTTQQVAEQTGIAERTLTNSLWGNRELGAQTLRKLFECYQVSIDWLLFGVGEMFYQPQRQGMIIDQGVTVDDADLADVYRLYAGVIERSLIEAGGKPGVDYTLLDLYRFAQKHVLNQAENRSIKPNFFSKPPQRLRRT